MVALYLGMVVMANIAAAHFGPQATPLIALGLIGPDLTIRDALHDRWGGGSLWPRMLALLVTGAALSYMVGGGSGRVGAAGAVCFLVAGAVDALVYQLDQAPKWERMVVSNLAAAAVDSALFLPLAFGVQDGGIAFQQFVAKGAGSIFWVGILARCGKC